jgi:uncharacterized protein YecT (DUF1311 family)
MSPGLELCRVRQPPPWRMTRYLCLLLSLSAASLGAPTQAEPGDPFAYRMEVTPEDGTVNPQIDRRYTAAFTACQAHANGSSANAQCFVAEFDRQDAALNRTWKATLGRLPSATHQPLKEAQRKWIAARDPFCKARSDDFSGGTIAPIIYVNCRVELTIRRSMWLERLR